MRYYEATSTIDASAAAVDPPAGLRFSGGMPLGLFRGVATGLKQRVESGG